MQLSEVQIASFQKLYKSRFGIELNIPDARQKGMEILGLKKNLLDIVLRNNEMTRITPVWRTRVGAPTSPPLEANKL